MKVRFAKLKDKQGVLKILDELGEEVNKKIKYSPHNTEAQKVGGPIFEEVIKRKDTMIFVAEEKGQIIGVITLYILPNIRHGYHRGHIEDIVVTKSKRKQGVGRKLMDAVKKFCKEQKIKVIKLDSGLELIDAHRFYQNVGGKHTEKMFRFNL